VDWPISCMKDLSFQMKIVVEDSRKIKDGKIGYRTADI
jgi:hypothetical protein